MDVIIATGHTFTFASHAGLMSGYIHLLQSHLEL